MKLHTSSLLPVAVLLLAHSTTAAAAAAAHARSLLVQPLPLPTPFAVPSTVADSARQAYRSGRQASYATDMCNTLASKDVQGTREFRDVDGVQLWPMFINIARAANVYGDEVARQWADVFARCNAMGGLAAEGVGYGIAYIYAEGLVESLGITKILQYAYAQTGSCASVNKILDVAAAVIKARDVAADELRNVMQTYDAKLAPCTPPDSAQRYTPYTLKGTPGVIKSKGARSVREGQQASAAAKAAPAAAAAAGRVAMERGSEVAGH